MDGGWLQKTFESMEREGVGGWNVPNVILFLPGKIKAFQADVIGRLRSCSMRAVQQTMEIGRSRSDGGRMPVQQGSRVTAYTVRIRRESCELTLHDALSVENFFGGLVQKDHLMQMYDSGTDSLLIQAMWCPHWCKTVQHKLPSRIPREGEPELMAFERIISFHSNVGMILQAKVLEGVERIVKCIIGQAKTPLKIRRLDLFFM